MPLLTLSDNGLYLNAPSIYPKEYFVSTDRDLTINFFPEIHNAELFSAWRFHIIQLYVHMVAILIYIVKIT